MKASTAIGVVIAMTGGVASAGPPYGDRKDIAVCAKSLEGLSTQQACDGPAKDVPADCSAEVQKRVDACKKKPTDATDEIDDCKQFNLPDPAVVSRLMWKFGVGVLRSDAVVYST